MVGAGLEVIIYSCCIHCQVIFLERARSGPPDGARFYQTHEESQPGENPLRKATPHAGCSSGIT